jgi:hypothetical protein
MQNHRVARDQLLAFETVDHEAGRCREIEFGQLRRDRIEPVDRATVIVFVMTDEQLSDIPLIRVGSQASGFMA